MKKLKLKFARMEKDILQIDLAKTVGVTHQTIGMIESGDYNPSLKLYIAICKALDLKIPYSTWMAKDLFMGNWSIYSGTVNKSFSYYKNK